MPEKTIAELDAEFEAQQANAEETAEQEVVDVEIPEIENTEDFEEVEVEEPQEEQETQQNKQEYAWKEMREKNRQLQEDLRAKEEYVKRLEQMAKGLGYDSSTELLERFDSEQTEKEAKERGVDPAFYKEFKELQSELVKTKEEKAKFAKEAKLTEFANELDNLINTNGLTENDKTNIIKQLEDDGYTIDDIIAVKSPKRLLSGYMVDMLAEKKVQAQLKAKKEAFKDEKHDTSVEVTEDDLDKQLKDELAAYARQQGYRL